MRAGQMDRLSSNEIHVSNLIPPQKCIALEINPLKKSSSIKYRRRFSLKGFSFQNNCKSAEFPKWWISKIFEYFQYYSMNIE